MYSYIELPATRWMYNYIVEYTPMYWTISCKLNLQLYIELPATRWMYSYIELPATSRIYTYVLNYQLQVESTAIY